jgi:competence protein ComEC
MGSRLFPAVIAFTAGVLVVHHLPGLPAPAALALLALPALLPWRGRALWAAAVLGIVLTTWRAQLLLDERWPVASHGADHVVAGHVASLPERGAQHWRFRFEPADPGWPAAIRVAWYRTETVVRGGECWRFTLRLRAPHGTLNPGGFDYEGWLFRQGIGATATVRDAQRCELEGGYRILELRQRAADAIHAALPEHPAAGLLVALTVGEQAAIGDDDWDAFRATGTSHLVAISGFNIAIIAAVAFFLCRWLWSAWPRLCLALPAQRAGLLGSAVLAGAYALLAGFAPPVQRAALMLWLVLAALWVHRPSRPARVLALAWVLVLLLDPSAVLSPGLWLSFGAVAAILYVSLGRVRSPGLWHSIVLLQLLIALALAPLSLAFFHGVSWIAPLVNLVAVPFFTLLTPWALLALVATLAAPAIGTPLLLSAAWALEGFRQALHAIAQAPGLWLPGGPPALALLVALPGVALLFAPRGLPLRPLGWFCLVPLVAVEPVMPRGGFELTALDVGQGLAVVIRTARHTLVYDAGPAFEDGLDAGASVVAPFLLEQGVRDVDVLLVSHGDNDHAGGAAAVRELLDVGRHLGAGGGEPCRAGQGWEWDGVRFAILHPDGPGGVGVPDNDRSCVLRVAGPFTVLLPGDIEAGGEQALLDRAAPLRADVLLAPHHGSRSSSSPDFIAAVQPRVVIHSAGWRHHFRHPRPQIVARYAASGARQYVTGASGAITVVRDAGGELQVSEYRREAARFWNAAAGP